MILYIVLGFILATIGLTLLNSLSEIISALTEWIKAAISVKIIQHNVTINQLNSTLEKTHTRAIGFATTFEEEEEEYE